MGVIGGTRAGPTPLRAARCLDLLAAAWCQSSAVHTLFPEPFTAFPCEELCLRRLPRCEDFMAFEACWY